MNASLYSQISEKYEYLKSLDSRLEALCTQSEKRWCTLSGKQYSVRLRQTREYISKLLSCFGEEFEKCSASEENAGLDDFCF